MMRKLFPALILLLGATLAAPAFAEGGGSSGPYIKLAPPFVVNLQAGNQVRFMQVKIQAYSKKSEAPEAIKKYMPEIRDHLILLLSSQSQATMENVQAREKVRAEALKTVQEVLKEHTGKPLVKALYFTDLVIQ